MGCETGGGGLAWKQGGDVRREDVAQKRILVPDERECLCELGLRIGVVLKGFGGGGTHGGSGGLLGCGGEGLSLDATEERTHCY